MKKSFKSLLVLILTLTVALAAVGTGCNNKGGDEGGSGPSIYIPEPPAPVLNISRSQADLTIGDYFALSATASNTTNKIVWSSSNPAVATVDSASGKVEAISQGYATITASCGELTKSCEVNVDFGGQTPEVDLLGGFKDEIILSNNDSYAVKPIVRFNNRTDYTDATYSLVSSNPNVVSIDSNNVISTHDNGEVDVTLSATWRGKNANNTYLMTKNFKVTVQDNLIFYVNGENVSDVQLYTRGEFEGTSYVNSVDFVPTVSVNGAAEVPATGATIANDEIADVVGNTIVGKTSGNTIVSINYVAGGKTFIKNFTVFVQRPVAQKAGKINYFSTYQGTYKDEADLAVNKTLDEFVWGTATEIIDAYQGETKLDVKNNVILGVKANADSFADTVITVGSKTEIYEVSVRAAGAFVKTAADLKDAVELRASAEMLAKRQELEANGGNPSSNLEYNEQVRKTDYVFLLDDIDATDLEICHTASASIWNHADEMSFAATFDGNGHVISNMNADKFSLAYQNNRAGLFAHLGKDSVIKNVAFTNVFLDKRGQVFAFTSYGKFENVYVSIDPRVEKFQGLTYYTYEQSNMTNVVVEYDTTNNFDILDVNPTTGNNSSGWGVLYASPSPTLNPKKEIQDALFKDVYVLSRYPLASYRDSLDIKERGFMEYVDAQNNTKYRFWSVAYAENIEKDCDGKAFPETQVNPMTDKTELNTGSFRYKNIKQYKNAAEMAAAGNNLSSFDSKYWDISSGVPVWHTFKAEGVTLSVEGETPLAPVNVVKGESVTVGFAKNGVLLPGTTITASDNSVIGIDGANVSVIKYSSSNVTITVKNDTVGVEKTFQIKPLIDVNLKLGNTNNITVYGEILKDETLAFSVEGATNLSVASNNSSIVSTNGANITGVAIDETIVTVSFTYNGSEYVVPVTIYVKDAPVTENNVVLYDANKAEVLYDDFDDRIILDAHLVVDGADPVKLTVKDNAIIGVPGFATGYNANHTFKLVVNTNYNTVTFNNVEYWDYVIYNAYDFTDALDYTSLDESPVIGWYTLGNDINFKVAEKGTRITDMKHDFDISFQYGADSNGVYHLIDRFNVPTKSDVFTAEGNNGFGGVFDGRGYVMYNYVNLYATSDRLYCNNGGLFGKLYSTETITPVVRNFALKDYIASGSSPVIADIVSNKGVQRIENIYIDNKLTLYSSYQFDMNTNVMKQDLPCSGYSISGIVKSVGHTYMKDVVYAHTNFTSVYNYNAYSGGLGMGSLASYFNEVFADQTIASYDANYLENVVIMAPQLLAVHDIDHNIKKTFTARSATSYASYGANYYPTAIASEGVNFKTPYKKNDNGTFELAFDDFMSITPGDATTLANGIYRFKNAYHYVNKNRFNYAGDEGLAIINKLTQNSYWSAVTTQNQLAINWVGNN